MFVGQTIQVFKPTCKADKFKNPAIILIASRIEERIAGLHQFLYVDKLIYVGLFENGQYIGGNFPNPLIVGC
jgi:hypothetical protein